MNSELNLWVNDLCRKLKVPNPIIDPEFIQSQKSTKDTIIEYINKNKVKLERNCETCYDVNLGCDTVGCKMDCQNNRYKDWKPVSRDYWNKLSHHEKIRKEKHRTILPRHYFPLKETIYQTFCRRFREINLRQRASLEYTEQRFCQK